MKIDRRIPEPVQPIIRDYVRLIEQRLVGLINGSIPSTGWALIAEEDWHAVR